ncbi:hypothetical protein CE665_24915 [Salmonella enterica subsp. enterica serovar Poona]|nr:hypothetical protein [Salmonella enterica subsp. enterica serovar Poona]
MRTFRNLITAAITILAVTAPYTASALIQTNPEPGPGNTSLDAVKILGEYRTAQHTVDVHLVAAADTVTWTDASVPGSDRVFDGILLSTAKIQPGGDSVCVAPGAVTVTVTNHETRTLTHDSGLLIGLNDETTPLKKVVPENVEAYCSERGETLTVTIAENSIAYGPGQHNVTLAYYAIPH